VFLDTDRLSTYDQGYVESSLYEFISAGGGLVTRTREAAELVLEARATLANHRGEWGILIPVPHAEGARPPEDIEEAEYSIVHISYVLHQSFAHVQLFAYERETGTFVFGDRDAWGQAYVGFFDDIYPRRGIHSTISAYTE
jgi:hypothetical protein